MHGRASHIPVEEAHSAAFWPDQSHGHVKRCGLPRTVRAEQSYNLALKDMKRQLINYPPTAVALDEILDI
jgi:hypothetical protein